MGSCDMSLFQLISHWLVGLAGAVVPNTHLHSLLHTCLGAGGHTSFDKQIGGLPIVHIWQHTSGIMTGTDYQVGVKMAISQFQKTQGIAQIERY